MPGAESGADAALLSCGRGCVRGVMGLIAKSCLFFSPKSRRGGHTTKIGGFTTP